MERKEALQIINNLINFANEALKEDCPYIGINEDDLTALLFASLDMEIKPHGEWLNKEFNPFLKEYGQCSNCLQIERVGNFCRNCGADMRGGAT